MHTKEEKLAAFGRLLDTMDALRERCPWNAAQTMKTIRPMTEEEVYELSDAILKGDRPGTAKEIGMIFLAMAIGLASGMGYVALAVLFFVFRPLLTKLFAGLKTRRTEKKAKKLAKKSGTIQDAKIEPQDSEK